MAAAALFTLILGLAMLAGPGEAEQTPADPAAADRRQMIQGQIEARGISNRAVLDAMTRVPRHLFVPPRERASAYEDRPLPIGFGQTISQPYIVAYMTEALQISRDHRVLEIGTGSGYQGAVLAEIVDKVYSIEIVEPLAREAQQRLQALGYRNVEVRVGDGHRGLPEFAPYDGIVVTAAAQQVPDALVAQLKPGARMVIPIGLPDRTQDLVLVHKQADGTISRRVVLQVRFVPMTKHKSAA